VSEALERIDRLRSTNTKADALDALWDLRDLAYDRPEAWHGFTAELLFQAFAENVDGAAHDAIDWGAFTSLLAAILTATVQWSSPQTP
jgi:hypothetical protein